MRNLFLFLFRFRGALVFGLLEIVSLYLFVTNNSYQRAVFFNSANSYAGVVLDRRAQVIDYFHLAQRNQQLMAENAVLRQQLYPADSVRREADSVAVPPARLNSKAKALKKGVGPLYNQQGVARTMVCDHTLVRLSACQPPMRAV